MAHSLHRGSGGKRCQHTEPTEREGFALAVGSIMQWSKLRDSCNPNFFPSIACAVKRCEGTERDWDKDDIIFFVQQRLFGGIPQYAVETWIQREFMGIKGTELVAKRADVIQNFMYKYLATVDSGVDHESAMKLANKANIDSVLKCPELGGRAEWKVEDFLDEEAWDVCGGKAGLKGVAKKLLTFVAARGRKAKDGGPLNPVCKVCGELKFIHRGDRCKLDPIACKCQEKEADDEIADRRTTEEPPPKRTRGFSQDLDPMCHGMMQTFERKCRQIDARYPGKSAKEIVKALLGRSAQQLTVDSEDEEDEGEGSASTSQRASQRVGVTGEQGGRLLTCFLVRAERAGDVSFLADGVAAFLEKQLPKVALYPAAKLCIEKAIKFLPKLNAAFAAARAAAAGPSAGPELDFGSDDESD